jgi:hypothetical protein
MPERSPFAVYAPTLSALTSADDIIAEVYADAPPEAPEPQEAEAGSMPDLLAAFSVYGNRTAPDDRVQYLGMSLEDIAFCLGMDIDTVKALYAEWVAACANVPEIQDAIVAAQQAVQPEPLPPSPQPVPIEPVKPVKG